MNKILAILWLSFGLNLWAGEVPACDLLSTLDTLSAETLDLSIPKPKYGRAMILLGFFKESQKNGELFFDIARKLSEIFSKSDSDALGFRYRRQVLTYYNFAEAFPVTGITNTIERVTVAIDSAIKAAGDKRVVWVNLDGFAASEAFQKIGDRTATINGVFNKELEHLLVPDRINKVRWLLAGREISPATAKTIFSPYFQNLNF